MESSLVSVSWLAIFLTTAIGGGLGAVWFARAVPGLYITALGRQSAPAHRLSNADYAGQLASLAVIAATTAYLMAALNIQGGQAAAQFGLFTGVGYLCSMTYLLAINPNVPRPLLYLAINAPYFLAVNIVGCLLQVYFRA